MFKRVVNNLSSLLLMFLFIFLNDSYSQQLKTPRISPQAEVSQTIGLSSVTINYSRPGVKGRKIWGGLVPYGLTEFQFGNGKPSPWRAGADENTTVSFSDNVKINGHELKAGKYGFHIIVNENEDWVLIFSSDNQAWGSFFYETAHDVLRVTAKPEQVEFNEWLRYEFDSITNNSAKAYLHWEYVKVGFTCEFDVVDITVKSLREQLTGQAGFDWQSLQQAAMYCFQNNANLDEAGQWMKKSISLHENQSNRNMLGLILLKQNKNEEALHVLRENIDKYQNDWNVYYSYAEALEKTGNKDECIGYYKKALKKAPDNQKQRIENKIIELE